MIVIYHSRDSLSARVAASIHVGRLPLALPAGEQERQRAWELVDGDGAASVEGLWQAGVDEQGRHVFAMGRASRPDVIERAFGGLSRILGIAAHAYHLGPVRPRSRNTEQLGRLLRRFGLAGAATRVHKWGIGAAWEAASEAVGAMQPQLAESSSAYMPDGRGDGLAIAGRSERGRVTVFYCCYGGAHSSITAANLHLGHLPMERRPSIPELVHQPLFDRAEDGSIGDPHLMGTDDQGCTVYAIGLAAGARSVAYALRDFLRIHGIGSDRVRLEDALQHAGIPLRIGGYTSRKLGLVWCGRPLCGLGVWLKYRCFTAHVRRVKGELAGASRVDAFHRMSHNR